MGRKKDNKWQILRHLQEQSSARMASADEVAPLLLAASERAIPEDDDQGKQFGRGKRPRPAPNALRDVHTHGRI